MTSLSAAAPRLKKLVVMLSSDKPGEVFATVEAMKRTLAGNGLSFHDLATVFDGVAGQSSFERRPNRGPPVWSRLCDLDRLAWLSAVLAVSEIDTWQHQFCEGVGRLVEVGRALSPKQAAAAQSVLTDAWMKGIRP